MAAKTKARKTKTKARTKTQEVAEAPQSEAVKKKAAAEKKGSADPWSDVSDQGSHLYIGNFLTFQLTRLANAAKSNVTRRYLSDFGLSVPEWRLLAMTMRFQPARFSELVVNSSMDKGQASRTLHGMIDRGLVTTKASPAGSRRAGDTSAVPVVLTVTAKGRALYKSVLPVAQRNQAKLLEKLTREERRVLYVILSKLFSHIGSHADDDEE